MTEVKDPGRGRLSPWSVALRSVAGLWAGLAMVLRHLGRRPVTEEYPEYKRLLPERSRARIILTRDPDGERTLRGLLSLRRGLPHQLHLHGGGGAGRMAAALPPGSASILPAAFTAACARRPAPPWPSS